jgi:site-specific recombinase XerD
VDLAVIRDHPVPMEGLAALPAELDGSQGENRSLSGGCQIQAENDWQDIQCWLEEFEGSPQTSRAYRKEAERLLLWSVRQRHKALSSLLREDFHAYQLFLADPQPATYWCGNRALRHSPAWKPFKGPLSTSSQRHSMIVINALLSYLVEAGYLQGNPLSLIRRRNRTLNPETREAISQERFLDQETWKHLKIFVTTLPQNTPREIEHYERLRFLFHFLYLLAPRVSEIASHPMNSFREFRGHWWWFVLGKGEKRGKVPVTDEMLDALMRYRRFLQLTDLPTEEDNSPLLRSLKGNKGITANMIYRLVKATVTQAAGELEGIDPIRAAKLRNASTHWFRHYVSFLTMSCNATSP